jgi:hypothetical protein
VEVLVKRCKAKGCTNRFQASGFVVWCSAACGALIAQERLAKKRSKESAAKSKQERAELKVRKEKLEPISYWEKKAEAAVESRHK